MEKEDRILIVCGDVHGKFDELAYKIKQLDISGASILVCGDFGYFSQGNFMHLVKQKLLGVLEDRDITVYAVRGNHDNPDLFKEENNLPRVKFLEDHKVYNIEGRVIYPIGGANSIDYLYRLEHNSNHPDNPIWWENEGVIQRPINKLGEYKMDIVISHECPLAFSPIISRPDGLDSEMYGKILDTRTYLNEVLRSIDTKFWYYGHYHISYSGSYNKTVYRCLNELELLEVPQKEKEVIDDEE